MMDGECQTLHPSSSSPLFIICWLTPWRSLFETVIFPLLLPLHFCGCTHVGSSPWSFLYVYSTAPLFKFWWLTTEMMWQFFSGVYWDTRKKLPCGRLSGELYVRTKLCSKLYPRFMSVANTDAHRLRPAGVSLFSKWMLLWTNAT